MTKVRDLARKYLTTNPFEIAKSLNIFVHEFDLHKEISGFYMCERRNKFIILNSNLEEHEMNFVCAHELGHAIFHPDTNYTFLKMNTLYPLGKLEKEANQFAVALLQLDYESKNDYLCETAEEYCIRSNIPKEMRELLRKKKDEDSSD